MTEPMIQRVIQAIADNMPSPYAADIYWHPLPEGGVRFDIQKAAEDDQWQKVARAVIAAMCQPADAMSKTGYSNAELIAKLQEFAPDIKVVTPGFDEFGYEDIRCLQPIHIARASYHEAGRYDYIGSIDDDIVEEKTALLLNFQEPPRWHTDD